LETEIYEHVKEGLTKRGRPKCAPAPLLGYVAFLVVAVGLTLLRDYLSLRGFGVLKKGFLGLVVHLTIFLLGYLASRRFHENRVDALNEKVQENDGQVCVKCGYILKGLGETGTCPECAMPFDIAKVQRYWRREYFNEADTPDPEDIRILREQMERERR